MKWPIALAGAVVGSIAGFYVLGPAQGPVEPRLRKPGATVAPAAIDGVVGHEQGLARPVPRFVTKAEGVQVETDPRSPTYDPTKLSAVGRGAAEILAAEPRVAAWAAPMEKMLSTRVAADVAHFSSRARVVGVDCRSHSCMISVEAPEADVRDVDLALQILRPGDVFEAAKMEEAQEKGWRRLNMPVLFAKQNHDVQAAARMQEKRRQTALQELRGNASLLEQLRLDSKKLPPD